MIFCIVCFIMGFVFMGLFLYSAIKLASEMEKDKNDKS